MNSEYFHQYYFIRYDWLEKRIFEKNMFDRETRNLIALRTSCKANFFNLQR